MKRTAEFTLILIFSLLILFHLLVIMGLLPNDIVWGGRLNNANQVMLFEAVSIILNGLFLTIMLIRVGLVKVNISAKIIKAFQWAMLVLFLINTVGNLFSDNSSEKMIFTPVTALLSICLFISLLSKQKHKSCNSTKSPIIDSKIKSVSENYRS